MTTRALILLAAALGFSCSRTDRVNRADSVDRADSVARVDSPSAVTGDSMASPRAWAVPPTQHNLRCAPEVLRRGDTLTMRMTLPHGPSFTALAPDGTAFLVVFHGEGSPDRTQRKSLMPPDSFATVTELRLDPRTLTAGAWVFGRDTNELLFRQPGFYRLHVGSDMETDGPIYAECVVRYAP